jgi:hypothetical protein
MMQRIFFFIAIVTFAFYGFPADADDGPFLKYKSKKIETIGGKNSIEHIEYEYEKPGDHFWSKSVHTDKSGKKIKTVIRKLDENRMPEKEITYEFDDIVTKTIFTGYDEATGELLSKEIYDGSPETNAISSKHEYNYENGRLASERAEIYFSDPNFVNEDGNRVRFSYTYRYVPISPNYCSNSGDHNLFVEKMKSYARADRENIKKGDLVYIQFTEFGDDGLPVYFKSTAPKDEHHATEAWYEIIKNDDGTVATINGYANEDMTERVSSSTARVYEYDADKMIASFKELKYSPAAGEYGRLHSYITYDWRTPGNYGCTIARADKNSRSYCFHRQLLTIENMKIVEYDNSQLIFEEYEGTKKGEYDPSFDNTRLTNRVTISYEIID